MIDVNGTLPISVFWKVGWLYRFSAIKPGSYVPFIGPFL